MHTVLAAVGGAVHGVPERVIASLCAAVFFGALGVTLADRLKVPSIALLLLGGVLLGPQVLGWVQPEMMEEGHLLEVVIAMAVSIILFEGGLTLDITGFQRAPRAIFFMLTVGVAITWLGAALGVYLLFGVERDLALLAGSLLIVTGPTVVSPILRRVGVRERIKQVLYWEGVLVDAVGVFVALLCLQWATLPPQDHEMFPVGYLALRFLVGLFAGFLVGLLLGQALKREWIPREHVNIAVLSTAVLALALSNLILPEAGILSVIVAGLTVSAQKPPQLRELKRFKLELTELSIGTVFILLAARLQLDSFLAYGWRLPALLLVVVLVLRPLNVFFSTLRQNFSTREKLFMGWLAPRGIVAASMAVLFTLKLRQAGKLDDDPQLLETITYAVIATTVLLQGLSAPWVARKLGLKKSDKGTLLAVGEPVLVGPLARSLRQAGVATLVVNNAPDTGELDGLDTVDIDPLNPESADDPRLADVEALLCLVPSREVATWAEWSRHCGSVPCYYWHTGPVEHSRAKGVWRNLPAPEAVAAGLAEGQYALKPVETGGEEDARRFGRGFFPLVWVDGQHAKLVGDPVAPGTPDGANTIVLYPRIPHFKGLIEDAVIVDEPDPTFSAVVTALLDEVAAKHPRVPVDKLLAGILEREQTMSTAIGHGVAIPHTYEQVPRSVCYVANVVHGLPNKAFDAEPVRMIFLLISPEGHAHEHLKGLAAIAQLASDRHFLDYLTEQKLRTRLLSIIRERE